MIRSTCIFIGAILLLTSCSKGDILTLDDSFGTQSEKQFSKAIIHHASAGSNDACSAFGLEPGCDKSFSLVANMHADGTVKGQWQDKFANGEGIHVDVDCLIVDGNKAIIGGIVKKGILNEVDLTGTYAVTALQDNGTSSGDDLDNISYTYSGFDPDLIDCNSFPFEGYQLLPLEIGQVKVW